MNNKQSTNSLEEFLNVLREHEIKTFSKFVCIRSQKAFTEEKFTPNENTKIHWNGAVPHINIGCRVYACHQGKHKNLYQKKRYAEKRDSKACRDHDFTERRKLAQPTKKLDCPVVINVYRVLALPRFKMASLQGLPPLPKSLSGLLNFSSTQWKEMERLHTMRTMIQQDLSRGTNLPRVPSHSNSAENVTSNHGSPTSDTSTQSRSGRLDVQLALLRKEMVGLRQLDMSLLCQLWSLNESIHEYKQLLQDRMSLSLSPSHNSSGWDNGLDSPSSEEHGEVNGKSFETETQNSNMQDNVQDYNSMPRKLSVDSTSHSSLEFGDI